MGWDKVYKDRYWKKEHFDEIEKLKVLLAETYPNEQVILFILYFSKLIKKFAGKIKNRLRWLYFLYF